MNKYFTTAEKILKEWKGDSYTFGADVLDAAGRYAAQFGKRAMVIVTLRGHPWNEEPFDSVRGSLESNGMTYAMINGARPNAPREDVYRIGLQVAK